MAEKIEAPWIVQWIAEVLRTIPSPNDAWASIIGSLAWPTLALFVLLRFRFFIRHYLKILADRLETDHVKLGIFELRPNDQILVLEKNSATASTEQLEAADVDRIERIFEFIADAPGLSYLEEWLKKAELAHIEIEDFLTLARYAKEREMAWNEFEGLKA